MKKTLSLIAILGTAAVIGVQSANAFSWSSLNPAYWGHCPKCEKQKSDCDCKKKVDEDCPCTTGMAAPCEPCAKKTPCDPCKKVITQPKPCDPCDRLQREMAK